MSLIKSIFPYPVLDTMIDNWDECKAEIKNAIELDNDKVIPVPEAASYTTNSRFICSNVLETCPKTRLQVEALLKIFSEEVGIKELELSDSWVNKYEYQQFLPPHNHLPHQVTGTIFIDIPSAGGEFFFNRPAIDSDQLRLRQGYTKMSKYSEPAWLVKPIEGQILVFLSHLYHASSPVMEQGFTRYTLAFNANCKKDN